MNKPVLCLDFDGVLHSCTSGWKGADVIPDPPVDGAKEFLEKAKEHFTIAIFSSRTSQLGGRLAMMNWCHKHFNGISLDFPMDKPAAKVSLDDRAITFTGVWPEVTDLINFKPWNK